MKKLFVILIACSFYLPEATQIIDFSQCVFSLFSKTSGEFCDCMITPNTASNDYNSEPTTTHNHKHVDVKLVDKICSSTDYNFLFQLTEIFKIHNGVYTPLTAQQHLQNLFRPPAELLA